MSESSTFETDEIVYCPFCDFYSAIMIADIPFKDSIRRDKVFSHLSHDDRYRMHGVSMIYTIGEEKIYAAIDFALTDFQIDCGFVINSFNSDRFEILGQSIYFEPVGVDFQSFINQVMRAYNNLCVPLEEKMKKLKSFI